MKYPLLWLIRLYQVTLSGLVPNTCRYEPTCSRYAEGAIARYGAFRGGWMALKRLSRCRPGGGSGYDPVPGDE